LKEIIANSHT